MLVVIYCTQSGSERPFTSKNNYMHNNNTSATG